MLAELLICLSRVEGILVSALALNPIDRIKFELERSTDPNNCYTIHVNDLFSTGFIIHCYNYNFPLGIAMKRFLTLLSAVLLFAIAVVLGLKNQQVININYLIAENEIRLATLLAIIFMLGFVVANLITAFFYVKLRMKNRQLRKTNNKQRKELEQLRTISAFEKE
jgi:putative membrane protein